MTELTGSRNADIGAEVSTNDCRLDVKKLSDFSAQKMATEVYDSCFRNSSRLLHVPVMKTGENLPALEKDTQLLPANHPVTGLYMDARKSIGRIQTADDFVGTGFFIDKDGLFGTDYHVVAGQKSVIVTTDDGKEHQAKVVAEDPKNDLALLKVEKNNRKETFHPVHLASFDGAKNGDEFVAAGYGVDSGIHVSPGTFDRTLAQKEIPLADSAPFLDPERQLAHLRQHTVNGDSGGLEFFLKDGTVRLIVGMTDNSKNTIAVPADRLIELQNRYLKVKAA